MVLLDLGLGSALAPGWAPLGVAVVMLVALALLWFSMRRHLKINERNEEATQTHAAESPHSPADL
ncbi:MAG: hypothetical protein QM708_11715 [Propioniciclava sp.]|uniref:hypothetical protein n=1 Tax=Propioniciclava sp. TaxID=2038686 RepID=UPI0039E23BEE